MTMITLYFYKKTPGLTIKLLLFLINNFEFVLCLIMILYLNNFKERLNNDK
jgi:hypothetical protein